MGTEAPERGRITLAQAVDRFLSQPDLAPSTISSYRQTLDVMTAEVGPSVPVKELSAADFAGVAKRRWACAAPAAWNRQVTTSGSFSAFARAWGWWGDGGSGLSWRREHPERTRAIPTGELERRWRQRDVALRDRALWRLLHESAARASEILSLDLANLDIDNKRAKVVSKGAAVEWVFFGARCARLLNRLVAARGASPVFLAERCPAPARAPAQVDLDPSTGRARLDAHTLRQRIYFGQHGKIRRADPDAQANALNLVTAAVTCWGTVYLAEVLVQLRQEGWQVTDNQLAHLSPTEWPHINPYGDYRVDLTPRVGRRLPRRPPS